MGCQQGTTAQNDQISQQQELHISLNDGLKEITIHNKSIHTILCQAKCEKTTITKEAYEKAFESAKSSEASVGVQVPIGGISAGVAQSKSVAMQQNGSWEKAFSGFITSGFTQVTPGSTKPFTIQGNVAFISVVAVTGPRVFIDNWCQKGNEFVFTAGDLNAKKYEIDDEKNMYSQYDQQIKNLKFEINKLQKNNNDKDVEIVELKKENTEQQVQMKQKEVKEDSDLIAQYIEKENEYKQTIQQLNDDL
eukprot:550450_1